MARAPRDYAAEYRRRIELAQSKGLSRAQGRRGAKKYATTPPREHVRRAQVTQQKYGLSPGQLARVRRAQRASQDRMHYQDLPFPDIRTACEFAREQLAPLDASFLVAYGTFRDDKSDSDYERTKTTNRGWAAVSSLALPSAYDDLRIARIEDDADKVFTEISRVILKVKAFGA